LLPEQPGFYYLHNNEISFIISDADKQSTMDSVSKTANLKYTRSLKVSLIKVMKSVVPNPIKRGLKDLLGITALSEQLAALELRVLGIEKSMVNEDLWERSRKRWREVSPDSGLTWAKEISGDNFIKSLQSFITFSDEKNILEIGPGYGRLLKSIHAMNIPFNKYIALDISQKNVDFLKSIFPYPSIEFFLGDVEQFGFNERFDIVFSSLTFKHLFPSFEKALINISTYMKPGGIIAFDLIEGTGNSFENDTITYVHSYSKEEVKTILNRLSLELVGFDYVKHTPDFVRLLVAAKK